MVRGLLLGSLLALAACQPAPPTEEGPGREAPPPVLGNARCPVSGGLVAGSPDAPTFTAVYQGVTIGFTCPVCVRQFDAASPAQKQAWLEQARASSPQAHAR
jgi:hypothetical protein